MTACLTRNQDASPRYYIKIFKVFDDLGCQCYHYVELDSQKYYEVCKALNLEPKGITGKVDE